MFSPTERERINTGIGLRHGFSTEAWRQYFSYLLGRHVTLQETDTFLREDFAPAPLPLFKDVVNA